MSELFDEVNEDVRREQLKKLWEKYSFLIVGAAILFVAAVAGWRGYQYLETRKAQEAGAAFDRAVELAEQNKSVDAQAAFAKIGADGPAGYRTLARLRAADEAARNDRDSAVKQFDAIVADTSVGPTDRDLARVRAAALLVDTQPYDAMAQRLEPAAGADGAYRHTARELLALSAWRVGDTGAARKWLDLIAADAATPSSMRSRAEALQALLPPAEKS